MVSSAGLDLSVTGRLNPINDIVICSIKDVFSKQDISLTFSEMLE